MENAMLKERLQRVAGMLCSTKMRVDQVEATDRIRTCARELMAILDELDEEETEGADDE